MIGTHEFTTTVRSLMLTSRKTVVVRAGALGDFVLVLPLVQALLAAGRHVRLVTRASYGCLLPPCCQGVEMIDLNAQPVNALFQPTGPLPSVLRSILDQADLCLFTAPDATIARRVAGLVSSVSWFDPRPNSPPHVAVRYLAQAGFAVPHGMLDRPLWPQRPTGDALWIHPGSGSGVKNAPVSFFAEVAKEWQLATGEQVVVSFGEADLALLEPVRTEFARRQVACETVVMPRLAELVDWLPARARRYLGNDSGVSHLAAALGLSAVVLFGPTDPRVWRPIGHCTVLTGLAQLRVEEGLCALRGRTCSGQGTAPAP